jgi:hypothetical protein
MKRGLAAEFNHEVETYRKALLYYAKSCEWEAFKAKAGRMFDYVESIELKELERRFFTTFNLILGGLILALACFFSMDFEVHQELMQMKGSVLFCAIAVCSFELYFYLDYRIYVNVKTTYYAQRRTRFIQGIESDFRSYTREEEVRVLDAA